MLKKIAIMILALFILMNAASALDSSNWTKANVGYEKFKIPPKYENPYSSDLNMYEFDEDIDVFTIRYVNPRIMDLYGYFLEHNSYVKKVNVEGHDAIHFRSYDRHDNANNSKLWFSAGDEFYYIAWRGNEITPEIKEVVKSANPSSYNKSEFYNQLNSEYDTYKVVDAIQSQRYDVPQRDSGHHSFVSFGSSGVNFGIMT